MTTFWMLRQKSTGLFWRSNHYWSKTGTTWQRRHAALVSLLNMVERHDVGGAEEVELCEFETRLVQAHDGLQAKIEAWHARDTSKDRRVAKEKGARIRDAERRLDEARKS